MGFAARMRGFMGYPNEDAYEDEDYVEETSSDVESQSASPREVVLVKPERFDDGKAIAEHIVAGKIVVINMETTNRDVARRLLDFVGGAAYARDGILSRVAVNVYIVTPNDVDYEEDALSAMAGSLF